MEAATKDTLVMVKLIFRSAETEKSSSVISESQTRLDI